MAIVFRSGRFYLLIKGVIPAQAPEKIIDMVAADPKDIIAEIGLHMDRTTVAPDLGKDILYEFLCRMFVPDHREDIVIDPFAERMVEFRERGMVPRFQPAEERVIMFRLVYHFIFHFGQLCAR